MGQTLSEPETRKDSSTGHDNHLYWAASSMQGWRVSMEDAHTTLLKVEGKEGYSFFGVYDGHGGVRAAKYSGANLHKRIIQSSHFESGKYKEAIKSGFLGTDVDLRTDPDLQSDTSGCTAITALITKENQLLVGNAGDSRAVLSIRGEAEALSFDHKPANKEESARIFAAGGFIEFGRVNGNLALSRAIGDFEFKNNKILSPEQQIVTANPDITERTLDFSEDEFVVLACDGIWDCMSNQDVVDFVRRGLAADLTLEKVCERMMDQCLAKDTELAGVGCDNMTVVIVALLGTHSTYDAWKSWVTQGVNPLPPPSTTTGQGEEGQGDAQSDNPLHPPPSSAQGFSTSMHLDESDPNRPDSLASKDPTKQ
ncbi:phosphatase 2C-like domain-containing protein [Piptocephalis cylindrospora]|uniref:protein-serine/threonine phosphatase n=1 Tax=Piptocephalis cylindrospora TaxID=1907219 RepID=A0A4P9Y1D3_9FUNG|nr:phosphatase 2C-like domain-containing protein [Piptocephalis cylindrospora]|eukprot:RKP12587.1 phosphatase 2C-like domain-containing protein [Piptocephalis cylindrospora]